MSRKPKRTVPYELNGTVHHVPAPPLPPDRDAQVLAAVTGVTALVIAGTVVWSTVAIGSLLSAIAPAWTAYLVAGVFDLAWITAMTLEWLSRYDAARARIPRWAGWIMLAVSMALIALYGRSLDAAWVGVCGSLVAAVSKCMWHLVMRHSAVRLSAQVQGWLTAEEQRIGAELALVSRQRNLSRTRARVERERLALGPTPGSHETPVSPTAETVSPTVGPSETPVSPPVPAMSPTVGPRAVSAGPTVPAVSPAPRTSSYARRQHRRRVAPRPPAKVSLERLPPTVSLPVAELSPDDQVAHLVRLIRESRDLKSLTISDVMGLTGKSHATAGRRLAEAREIVKKDPPFGFAAGN